MKKKDEDDTLGSPDTAQGAQRPPDDTKKLPDTIRGVQKPPDDTHKPPDVTQDVEHELRHCNARHALLQK